MIFLVYTPQNEMKSLIKIQHLLLKFALHTHKYFCLRMLLCKIFEQNRFLMVKKC